MTELQRMMWMSPLLMIGSNLTQRNAMLLTESGCSTDQSSPCTQTEPARISIGKFLASRMDGRILTTVTGNGSQKIVPCQGWYWYIFMFNINLNILFIQVLSGWKMTFCSCPRAKTHTSAWNSFYLIAILTTLIYIYRFNPELALKKLRGKRILFVGDSLQRGQWQSFVCLVESIIPEDKKSMKRGPSLSVFKAKV